MPREVAGLDWAQADQLRRGMGHFGADEMAALREQFVDGCLRPPPDGPGLSSPQAATLWEQVMAFAGYGFNQGHATAYADVSYRSAYLKAHWPAEFLCARLADYGGFHHPAIYMAEAIRLGIAVMPPHVNYSDEVILIDDRRWTNGRMRTADWPLRLRSFVTIRQSSGWAWARCAISAGALSRRSSQSGRARRSAASPIC